MRVPWTESRSNQSILKEISPEYPLEGLMLKVKEESEKAGLKLNIQNANIMVYRPITSRHIDEETMETVTDFIFGERTSKITADGACNHGIKRCILFGIKL